MKSLTVRQPWASAIAFGRKDVENRTWATGHRGLLAIHAGKGIEWTASDAAWIEAGLMPYRSGDPRKAWSGSLPLGAIVAVARLTDCHDATRTDYCSCSPWAMAHQWHWELADVRPLAEPVPCKGALRLWNLPEDVEAAVMAQPEVVRG
jgi:hypothetical protein